MPRKRKPTVIYVSRAGHAKLYAAVLIFSLLAGGGYYEWQALYGAGGSPPPPHTTGTLNVYAVSGSSTVPASVSGSGPTPFSGTAPLTKTLVAGTYTLTGTYDSQTETDSQPYQIAVTVDGTASITLHFQGTIVLPPLTGTWTQLSSPVITQDVAGGPEEPNVIYENGIFKMWYRDGWDTGVIRYATSSDGVNWSPQTLSGFSNWPWCPYVFKYGGTYYMYVHGSGGTALREGWDAGIDRYVSNDGINWYDDTPNTVSHSGWTNLGNLCVWVEDGSWKMLLEAIGSDGIWSMYYATSTDGKSWNFYSRTTPVLSGGQGPDAIKSGSTYYLWYHGGQLPTQIYLATSTNLINWTPLGLQVDRELSKSWEASQVADPSVVVVGTQVWMFFDALSAQSADHSVLCAAKLTPSG